MIPTTPADRLRAVGKLGPYAVTAKELVPPAPRDVDPVVVRAWAAETGVEVAAKGRIPAAVVEAYVNAHPEAS